MVKYFICLVNTIYVKHLLFQNLVAYKELKGSNIWCLLLYNIHNVTRGKTYTL